MKIIAAFFEVSRWSLTWSRIQQSVHTVHHDYLSYTKPRQRPPSGLKECVEDLHPQSTASGCGGRMHGTPASCRQCCTRRPVGENFQPPNSLVDRQCEGWSKAYSHPSERGPLE